jgi:hypothetical protein
MSRWLPRVNVSFSTLIRNPNVKKFTFGILELGRMLNNFKDIIDRLEAQKAAIDKAIGILRDFDGGGSAGPASRTATTKQRKKRVLSEAGRQAIRDAVKRRWAGLKKTAKKSA